MKCLDVINNSVDMSLSKIWETVKDRECWRPAVHGVPESRMTEQLNNDNDNCILKLLKTILTRQNDK